MDPLHNRLVEFIKPFVEGTPQHRHSTVRLALPDSPVLDHLDWSGGALDFAGHLLTTVQTWGGGRPARPRLGADSR